MAQLASIDSYNREDRDLLVRLDAKLDSLSVQFGEVRSAVNLKADAIRVEKLEMQIDSIEHKVYMAAGGLATLQVILQYAVPKILK